MTNIKVQKNIPLAQYATFKIGGPAKYFFVAKNNDEIVKAVGFAQNKKLPYFILGGGSNLLVNDKGFNGLVIKVSSQEIKVDNNKVFAQSGVLLSNLVRLSLKKGLTGLEWAVGIPGTIGGAIFGNAGSQRGGPSIGDVIEKVSLLNPNGQLMTVGKKWLNFDYRQSRLKNISKAERPIILSAVLKLERGDAQEIRKVIKQRLVIRKEHIPQQPSAGCIFKNTSNQSARQLIERAGLKGERIGRAMISEKQANFIVNLGGAQAEEVIKLIQLIKKTIKQKFKIELEEEIQYLGFL
jgi:UDP-N-acetylmuramate dehydrogenase